MAPPVALVLPGMTMNATLFPDFGVPTVAVDFNDLVLGHNGETDELVTQRMRLYVRLLRSRLLTDRRWTTAQRRIVVAHSFGGMLALAWVLSTPRTPIDEIHGLVLVGTTAGPLFDRASLRLFAVRGMELRLPLKHLIDWWNGIALTKAVKRMLSHGRLDAAPVDFQSLKRRSDLALDLAGWRNTDWRAMRSYRLAMMGFDVRAALGDVTVPTIVLHGDCDSLLPVSAGQELAARMPRAELRVVKGAGHGLPLTHGWAVREAVRDVLEEMRSGE